MTTSITRHFEDVPIFQGDDAAAIEEARREFNVAAAQTDRASLRLNDASPVHEAAEAFDGIVAEALPRAVTARVQALGRKAYRALVAQCPPRDENETDAALGFDEAKMGDLLLEHYDLETGEKTIVLPEFASKAALVAWLDDLNDGNFSQLFAAAVRVNEGGSPSPKASLTSQLGRLSAAT